MNDQAKLLRQQMSEKQKTSLAKKKKAATLAVVSGKGGVGKTNISVNFSIALARMSKKVLLFDMDIGMGNIYHLMNAQPEYSIADFFSKNIPLKQMMQTGPEGVSFIHGGSAFSHLFEWEELFIEKWIAALEELQEEFDYFIFDMGAGANKESLNILKAADSILTVIIPEPASITDAYSMMKFISFQDTSKQFYLLCNRADSAEEGQLTTTRVQQAMKRFLNIEPVILGSVPEDRTVRKAVVAGIPFLLLAPKSPASLALGQIIQTYTGASDFAPTSFIDKLRRLFQDLN